MTFDVPPGRIASGTSEPASPFAASETVPSPPQTATMSRPFGKNVRTISVASPGPLVGTFTSSRPFGPHAVDEGAHPGAAVPLAGGRVVDEEAALHGSRASSVSCRASGLGSG